MEPVWHSPIGFDCEKNVLERLDIFIFGVYFFIYLIIKDSGVGKPFSGCLYFYEIYPI